MNVDNAVAETSAEWLSIAELGQWCARRRATFLDLFEALGQWATDSDTVPGAAQRLWATAGHRHAWHAELCAERSPTVPIVDLDALTANYRGRLDMPEPDSRLPWYRLVVDGVLVACESLRARVDVTLDPSTDRLVDLLVNDLTDLRNRTIELQRSA